MNFVNDEKPECYGLNNLIATLLFFNKIRNLSTAPVVSVCIELLRMHML